jgi:hypothetical protein
MSNGTGSSIKLAVVTGFLALLGTIGAATLKGYWDVKLEKEKFQSTLILKALEAKEVDERRDTLKFLVVSNLIKDESVTSGLKKYFEGESPQTPPRVVPTGQTDERVIFSPRTSANTSKTDIDLFVCGPDEQTANILSLRKALAEAIQNSERYGEVIGKVWKGELLKEIGLHELQGKTTIIFDRELPEYAEVDPLKQLIKNVVGIPPVQDLDNRGNDTPWRISIVICGKPDMR